jgi:hypothetical protein
MGDPRVDDGRGQRCGRHRHRERHCVPGQVGLVLSQRDGMTMPTRAAASAQGLAVDGPARGAAIWTAEPTRRRVALPAVPPRSNHAVDQRPVFYLSTLCKCPVDAITADDRVPDRWEKFVQINADYHKRQKP